jgi:hypothetical protein
MTKRPTEEVTDHEDPDPAQPTVLAYHALPYPFGDQTAQSLYMWHIEQVMQHPDTPLTDKTREFIRGLYTDTIAAATLPEPAETRTIKVVK